LQEEKKGRGLLRNESRKGGRGGEKKRGRREEEKKRVKVARKAVEVRGKKNPNTRERATSKKKEFVF
jgi:hypothetical protein